MTFYNKLFKVYENDMAFYNKLFIASSWWLIAGSWWLIVDKLFINYLSETNYIGIFQSYHDRRYGGRCTQVLNVKTMERCVVHRITLMKFNLIICLLTKVLSKKNSSGWVKN